MPARRRVLKQGAGSREVGQGGEQWAVEWSGVE
jgi:hypothetical protein